MFTAIPAEYSGNCFLVYILRSAKPMLGMKGERFALLPLAIPHGAGLHFGDDDHYPNLEPAYADDAALSATQSTIP